MIRFFVKLLLNSFRIQFDYIYNLNQQTVLKEWAYSYINKILVLKHKLYFSVTITQFKIFLTIKDMRIERMKYFASLF